MGGLFLFVVVACESIGVDSTRQLPPAAQISDSIDEIEIPTSIPPSPRKPTIDNSGSWGADDFKVGSTPPIVIMTGPEHCGWENATFLFLSVPVGTVASSAADRIQFIKDPLGTMSSFAERFGGEFEADAELPADAEFSGYVNKGVELWISETVFNTGIFMVDGEHIEKWPRVEPQLGCD